MPLKEILGIAVVVMTLWCVQGGQVALLRNIRRFQVQVLHEIGRTSNWGKPSIFNYQRQKRIFSERITRLAIERGQGNITSIGDTE